MVLDALRSYTAGGAEGGYDGCSDGCNHLDDELQCFFLCHNGLGYMVNTLCFMVKMVGLVPQPLVANGLVATAAGIAATASVSTATGIATLSAATGITWLIILDKLASKRLGIYKLGLLDELTA